MALAVVFRRHFELKSKTQRDISWIQSSECLATSPRPAAVWMAKQQAVGAPAPGAQSGADVLRSCRGPVECSDWAARFRYIRSVQLEDLRATSRGVGGVARSTGPRAGFEARHAGGFRRVLGRRYRMQTWPTPGKSSYVIEGGARPVARCFALRVRPWALPRSRVCVAMLSANWRAYRVAVSAGLFAPSPTRAAATGAVAPREVGC